MNIIDVLKSSSSGVLSPNVHCPKVNTTPGPNWNTDQCILRIDEDSPCIYGCPVSKRICLQYGWDVRKKGDYKVKKRMTSNGITTNKPASRPRMKRESFGKLSGDSWKGLLEHERRWGHEALWVRNITLLVAVLHGESIAKAAKNADITKTRGNQIIKALCFALNPELYARLFDFVDGSTRFKVKLARDNKEEFIQCIPGEYPPYEGEEDA